MASVDLPVVSMSQKAKTPTLADLLERLGVPADRVLMNPTLGTATVDDVVALEEHENRLCELVEGVLVEKPMGYLESQFACVLIYLLKTFLIPSPLGIVAGPDGMIRLTPSLVRMPDVSFVSRDQFPSGRPGKEPVPLLSPTLAVEILSPSNTKVEMDRKIGEYFAAGSKRVWLLDPRGRTVRVYTSPDRFQTLDESQTLDGGEILPGFELSVREWFEQAENPFGEA